MQKLVKQFCILFIGIILCNLGCRNREIDNPVDPRYELRSPILTSVNHLADSSLTLIWSDISVDALEYIIFRKSRTSNYESIDTIEASGSSYSDTRITIYKNYIYAVRSKWYDRVSVSSNAIEAGVFPTYIRFRPELTYGLAVAQTAKNILYFLI